MIEAIGSMATSIGRAVSVAPSLGKEVGRGASGGSFAPGLKVGSIFAETKPFVAAAGSVPEIPISKSVDIFSGSWSTLGKANAPTLEAAPKIDPMRRLGFEPFEAKQTVIAEKSISLNKGEWFTLAKAPARTIAEKVFSETKPLVPENPVFSKTVTDKDITVFVESAYKATATEEAVIGKALQAEKEQSKKVVDLMTEVGLYTREEAAKRVAKIVEKRGLAETEAEAKSKAGVDTEPLAKPMPEASAKKAKTINVQTQVGTETENEKPEDQFFLNKKPEKEVPVVDEKAQASRKKDVGEKIYSLFSKARRFGLGKVSSEEITRDLEKKRENRSLLLRQLMYSLLPDGSLEEAAKAVESLGDLKDTSKMAEQEVAELVDDIFDKNIPVKLAKGNAKQVSDKDVKRVLKYLQPESIVG